MRKRAWAVLLALSLAPAATPAWGQQFQPPVRDPMLPPPELQPAVLGPAPGTEPTEPGVAPPAVPIDGAPDFTG